MVASRKKKTPEPGEQPTAASPAAEPKRTQQRPAEPVAVELPQAPEVSVGTIPPASQALPVAVGSPGQPERYVVEKQVFLEGEVAGPSSPPFRNPQDNNKISVKLPVRLVDGQTVEITERANDPYLKSLSPGDPVRVLRLSKGRGYALLEELPERVRGEVMFATGRARTGELGPVIDLMVRTERGESVPVYGRNTDLLLQTLQKGDRVELMSKLGPDANPENWQVVRAEILPVPATVRAVRNEPFQPALKGGVQYPPAIYADFELPGGVLYREYREPDRPFDLLVGQPVALVPTANGGAFEVRSDWRGELNESTVLLKRPFVLPNRNRVGSAQTLSDRQIAWTIDDLLARPGAPEVFQRNLAAYSAPQVSSEDAARAIAALRAAADPQERRDRLNAMGSVAEWQAFISEAKALVAPLTERQIDYAIDNLIARPGAAEVAYRVFSQLDSPERAERAFAYLQGEAEEGLRSRMARVGSPAEWKEFLSQASELASPEHTGTRTAATGKKNRESDAVASSSPEGRPYAAAAAVWRTANAVLDYARSATYTSKDGRYSIERLDSTQAEGDDILTRISANDGRGVILEGTRDDPGELRIGPLTAEDVQFFEEGQRWLDSRQSREQASGQALGD